MNFTVRNIFFFDSMLTPKLITFIYWLLMLAVVLGGILTMFNRFYGGFLQGLLIIVFGLIGVRIWCELLIVIFKIEENGRRLVGEKELPRASTGVASGGTPNRSPV